MLSCTSQDCYQDSMRKYMAKCWGRSWNGWRIWHPCDQKAWSVPSHYDSSLDSACFIFLTMRRKKKNCNTGCTPSLALVFSMRVRLQNSNVPSSSRNWPAHLFKGPRIHSLPHIWDYLLNHSIPPWLHTSSQEWQHIVHDLSFSKTYFLLILQADLSWMYASKLDLLNDPNDCCKTLYAPMKKMNNNSQNDQLSRTEL